DARAHVLHGAHELVAHDGAGLHERAAAAVILVQIRAAHRAGRDAEHDVARIDDLGIGDVLRPHVAHALEGDGFHSDVLSAYSASAAAPRTPSRLSPGTMVMRVAASARVSVYSAAAPRIFGSSERSDWATPPVMTTTFGFRPFTMIPSIAPMAWHASSTIEAATTSPSAAARKTRGAVMPCGSSAAALTSAACGLPATRARAASAIPRPLA